ncbi:glycosyltransferase family 2 protein [Pseudodesulfovibrio sp.]|uniref:glycosyltransferase n=1 Tax=Pseudodesulfovibrio sp. TaxID=2035812 RepID=UPI0026284DC2|nr:glycosyltransferase family 2 protein [Pseudodesulfovibrio sp.]MDD3311989.1 glycosyltransferase [Pseudodesulfovibrio sp.]
MPRPFDFPALPPDLLRPLLLGFSGRDHLHGLAARALAHSAGPDDVFAAIAGDALLAAWAENPLNGHCAVILAQSLGRISPPPPALLPVLRAVLARWRVEPAGEGGLAADQILKQLDDEPENLFWWNALEAHCRAAGDRRVLVDRLSAHEPGPVLASLFRYVLGNALLASGEPLAARRAFGRCASELPLPTLAERLATALHRAGESGRAQAVLREAASLRPWHAGLRLRLHDLAGELDTAAVLPEGRTAVLLHTRNRADALAETLESLLESDLGDVAVRVLDSGSTDDTSGVIRRFADRFGAARAAGVALPVDVGAPAARNWLLHLPEVRESHWTAFVGDDVSLPPDWLARLGAAAARYPEAGVWGCKVMDAAGPGGPCRGERFLASDPLERERELLAPALGVGDFGQADYVRPCASVSGGALLFRTGRLLAGGSFDLRFSPVGDGCLERDLRMVLAGGYAVYTGFLAVSRRRGRGDGPNAADAAANRRKLWAKYAPEEFEAMARSLDGVLLADLLAKINVLA